jgi:hypothetical protein
MKARIEASSSAGTSARRLTTPPWVLFAARPSGTCPSPAHPSARSSTLSEAIRRRHAINRGQFPTSARRRQQPDCWVGEQPSQPETQGRPGGASATSSATASGLATAAALSSRRNGLTRFSPGRRPQRDLGGRPVENSGKTPGCSWGKGCPRPLISSADQWSPTPAVSCGITNPCSAAARAALAPGPQAPSRPRSGVGVGAWGASTKRNDQLSGAPSSCSHRPGCSCSSSIVSSGIN